MTSVFAKERFSSLDKTIYQWRKKKVLAHLPLSLRVCDLGCGESGYFLRELSNIVSSGIGFDLKVDPLFENEKITLREADLNKPIPLANGSVDAVFSLAVIEHLDNTEQHIKESLRILGPNGRLILTTPSLFAKPILGVLSFFRFINKDSIEEHKHYLNKKELICLCNQAGFKKIHFNYFQGICNQLIVAEK
jgi:SAM-dependent methyltransferase